jgi:hypothetical protein
MLLAKPDNQTFAKVAKQTIFTNVHTIFQHPLEDLGIIVVPMKQETTKNPAIYCLYDKQEDSGLYEILRVPTKAKAQMAFFSEWWRGVVQTKADDRFNGVKKNIRTWINSQMLSPTGRFP